MEIFPLFYIPSLLSANQVAFDLYISLIIITLTHFVRQPRLAFPLLLIASGNIGPDKQPEKFYMMQMESRVTKLLVKKAHCGNASPNLVIAQKGASQIPKRAVRLSLMQIPEESDQSRTAEKIVASSRENVLFLNRHLRRFEQWLSLPAEVDNTLYLAYTVTVKPDAPFTADALRLWLTHHEIETQPVFSFVAPETVPERVQHRFNSVAGPDAPSNVFCLPCHHYVAIPDLMRIVEGFESFFDGLQENAPGLDTKYAH
jgi:hypothetical protein